VGEGLGDGEGDGLGDGDGCSDDTGTVKARLPPLTATYESVVPSMPAATHDATQS
jgi:hypothetical protein